MAKIEAKTKVKTDGYNEVNVGTEIEYDIPTDLQSAISKYSEDGVFRLFKAQLVVAAQAPMRKAILEEWNKLDPGTQQSLTTYPESDKGVATAWLNEEGRNAVQAHMSTWNPNERAARRSPAKSSDIVKDFMSVLGTMTPEKKAEMLKTMLGDFGGDVNTILSMLNGGGASSESAEDSGEESVETEESGEELEYHPRRSRRNS